MALPLVLIAAFADAGVSFTRRLGPHLPRIERVVGGLLVLVGALMILDGGRHAVMTP